MKSADETQVVEGKIISEKKYCSRGLVADL